MKTKTTWTPEQAKEMNRRALCAKRLKKKEKEFINACEEFKRCGKHLPSPNFAHTKSSTWRANPDLKKIFRDENRRAWIRTIVFSIILGIMLGILLINL